MREIYENKEEFISAFISEVKRMQFKWEERAYFCRVLICGEKWAFFVKTGKGEVSTCAWFTWPDGRETEYPLTTWGEPHLRWDADLREFLRREICKE